MAKYYLNNDQIKCGLKNMLFEVDAFLSQHNLQYTIYGGTLLGAVRHQGFIPWDDDIDLGMLRPEYEKLIEILHSENIIGGSLLGVGYEMGEGDWPFLKIVNPEIFVDEDNTGISKNLWIDIFPVDAAPNHFKKLYFFYLYYFLRRIFFSMRADIFGIKFEQNSNIFKSVYNCLIRLIGKHMKNEKVVHAYVAACKRYNISNAKYYSENVWGTRQFPRGIFDEYVKYSFEDLQVTGIKRSDEYLQILYGDYMKVPPENKRLNHKVIAWREVDSEK